MARATPFPTVDLAGIPVGRLGCDAWVELLAERATSARGHHHVSLNAAKWVAARRDPELRAALAAAGSIAADGVGVVLASRHLGDPLPERVPGITLAERLLARAPAAGWRVALLGAAEDVVQVVAADLRGRGVCVVAARHGWFTDDADVARDVGRAEPDLLLVALGTPRAEVFAHRHAATLGARLVLGVGGTFDVLAGRARRAPAAVQAAGLEWAWRWAGSPRQRFRRAILDSAAFAAAIARGERVTP